LFFFVEAGSPWVAEAPSAAKFARILLPRAQHVVSHHLIMAGSCFCELEGQAPFELTAGDGVVIPHGDRYALSSAPGMLGTVPEEMLIDWFRQMAAREMPDAFRVREGHGGTVSLRVLCGFLGCDAAPFNPVLSRLPKVLHLREAGLREREGLAHLIALASREVKERRAGSECVLLKISELMFVEVVRYHLIGLPRGERGWLAGLAEPVVGRGPPTPGRWRSSRAGQAHHALPSRSASASSSGSRLSRISRAGACSSRQPCSSMGARRCRPSRHRSVTTRKPPSAEHSGPPRDDPRQPGAKHTAPEMDAVWSASSPLSSSI
jgi:hypothetical protein